jgi:hypothetical protein
MASSQLEDRLQQRWALSLYSYSAIANELQQGFATGDKMIATLPDGVAGGIGERRRQPR